jgi:hypothetical protein
MIHARADREPLVQPGQIEHHVADLSATFAADVTLAAAQAKLRAANQWLPIDGDPNATLGSLVEHNSTGPLRLGFGAWRDLLLGAQFTNGAAELITAGGRTVKNVAGYDLTKFMVGQYGIFGKVVTLTTRAYKAPQSALLAAFDPDVKKLNALLVTPCRPQWAALTKDALLCGYLGDDVTIDFYQKVVPQYESREVIRQTLDDDIAARAKLWKTGPGTFRASLAPARIAEFAAACGVTDWCADAAFGVVVGPVGDVDPDALTKAAGSAGGTVVLMDNSGIPTNLSLAPGISSLLSRLKQSFDPEGKLPSLPVHAS